MPRNATPKVDEVEPTPLQYAVLKRLLAGDTVTSAARAAKVDRGTIHRWLREDYAFQAAHNRGRRELHDALQSRLVSLGDKAAQTVAAAVEGGNAGAALAVLKGLGLLNGEFTRIGSDDARQLREDAELTEQELSSEMARRKLLARL